MAVNRGINVSLKDRLGLKSNFNMAADGVDMQEGTPELERMDTANSVEPEELPSFGNDLGDVIQDADVEKAGALMCEIHSRIYDMTIFMQVAALNADNLALAEEIGQRWQEFTQDLDTKNASTGEHNFVSGLKQAAMAYNEVVYDIAFLANSDRTASLEVRLNSEAAMSMGRAKVGVHVLAEGELVDIANKVEADLQRAYDPQMTADATMDVKIGATPDPAMELHNTMG